jgi:uncharacterized membrane protein
MDPVQFWYLPLAPAFFFILVALLFLVFILVLLGLLRYAYAQLGVSPSTTIFLLLASLIGSYINIPITIESSQVIDFFGMRYQVPEPTDWGGTVLAVNVGGAVIPVVVSLYLLVRQRFWLQGLLATGLVAVICYWLSSPIPGVGIAVPVFVPAIAATLAAIILAPQQAAPLAYIAGSLGTLIGADLMNFGALSELGAPILSIGGAGTFDGVFLTGIVAVLIASIMSRRKGTPSTV